MALPVVSSDVMQIEASPSFEMHSDMLPPAQYGTKVSQYESAASVPSETLNQLVATLQAARAQVHDSAGIEKALSAALAEAGFSDIRVGARRRKADNPDGSLKRARIAEDVNKVRPKGPQPSAKCRVDGCNKYASFGYAGDKKVRCLQHIEEGMVDVKHVRRALEKSRSERCHADGCEKYASFGWPNSPGRIRCGTHMELGMIDRKHANREPKTLRRKGVRTDHRPVVNSTNIPPPIARLAALAASAGAHPQEGGMEHMLGLPQSQPQPHPVAAPDPALDPQQQQMLIQQKHYYQQYLQAAQVQQRQQHPQQRHPHHHSHTHPHHHPTHHHHHDVQQQLDARMEGVGVGVGVDDAEGGHVEVDEMGAVDDGVPEGAEEEAWLEAQPGLAPAPAPPGEGGGADRVGMHHPLVQQQQQQQEEVQYQPDLLVHHQHPYQQQQQYTQHLLQADLSLQQYQAGSMGQEEGRRQQQQQQLEEEEEQAMLEQPLGALALAPYPQGLMEHNRRAHVEHLQQPAVAEHAEGGTHALAEHQPHHHQQQQQQHHRVGAEEAQQQQQQQVLEEEPYEEQVEEAAESEAQVQAAGEEEDLPGGGHPQFQQQQTQQQQQQQQQMAAMVQQEYHHASTAAATAAVAAGAAAAHAAQLQQQQQQLAEQQVVSRHLEDTQELPEHELGGQEELQLQQLDVMSSEEQQLQLALAPHQMIFATPRPHLQRGPRANHVCAQPGCKNTGKFNFPGGPRYCDEHRSDGMSFPKCGEEGCTNMPYYAFPMEHAPTRCKRHRQEGMVDKRGAHPSHRCNFGGCATIANFNYPGGPGRWCSKHKVDGMVNVKEKRQCAVEGCVIRPYFGYVDDERATRCAAHKEPGMIDIRNGKCEVDGCTKLPGYGFPVTPGPRARTKWDPPKMIRCSKHRLDGMVGLKNPRCEMDACVKQAVFAFPGERARRCTGHRLDGMLNPGAPALCADLDCRKAAKWGYEKDDRASRCKKHKLDGMMAWWWIVKMKKAASRGDPSLCMEVALALDDGPSPAAADPAGADNDMEARLDEAASATSIFRDVEEGEGPLKIGASAEARCRRQEEAEENGVPAVHDARLTRGAQHQPPALLSGLGLGGVGAGHELALGGGSKAPIPAGDPQLAMPPLQGGEERLEREGSNQQQRRRRQQRRRSNTLSPAGLRGAADLGASGHSQSSASMDAVGGQMREEAGLAEPRGEVEEEEQLNAAGRGSSDGNQCELDGLSVSARDGDDILGERNVDVHLLGRRGPLASPALPLVGTRRLDAEPLRQADCDQAGTLSDQLRGGTGSLNQASLSLKIDEPLIGSDADEGPFKGVEAEDTGAQITSQHLQEFDLVVDDEHGANIGVGIGNSHLSAPISSHSILGKRNGEHVEEGFDREAIAEEEMLSVIRDQEMQSSL